MAKIKLSLHVLMVIWIILMSINAVYAGHYIDKGDGTVEDSKTGLVWQQADDGVRRSWNDAEPYCESLNLAGHDDWRLPRIDELLTIMDHTRNYPALDPIFAGGFYYWSGSPFAADSDRAWLANFGAGNIGAYEKTESYNTFVRCVRRGPFWASVPADRMIKSEYTATDTYHGLTWMTGHQYGWGTGSWEDTKKFCEGIEMGGYSDWRLPTVEELRTIIDFTIDDVSWNRRIFGASPTTPFYWTATEYPDDSDSAYYINFGGGYLIIDGKFNARHARCVRGGEVEPPGSLTVLKTGDGEGVVRSIPFGIRCGSDCTDKYSRDTVVELKAIPGKYSLFDGWSGDGCSGAERKCRVTVAGDLTVTASFSRRLGSLSGTVTTAEGAPMESVTMTLSGPESRQTATAADGTYVFSDLPGGVYTLTPSRTGNLRKADITGKSFKGTLDASAGPIGDEDIDGDGDEGPGDGDEELDDPEITDGGSGEAPLKAPPSGVSIFNVRASASISDTLSKMMSDYRGYVADRYYNLVIDRDVAVHDTSEGADVTIPSNVTIRVEKGFQLTGDGQLTFEGAFSAPPMKVFSDPGSIAVKNSGTVKGRSDACYAEWFGADPQSGKADSIAIQKCLDGFNRWDGLRGSTYEIKGEFLTVKGGARISGNGAKLEGFVRSCGLLAISGTSGSRISNVNVSDLSINVTKGKTIAGVFIKNAENVNLHDVDVRISANCALTKAVRVHNSSSVAIRNFMLSSEDPGKNVGILYENSSRTSSAALENMLLESGTVKNFQNQVEARMGRNGSGNSWLFLNVDFVVDSNVSSLKRGIYNRYPD